MAGSSCSARRLVRRASIAMSIAWIGAVIYVSLRPFTFTAAPWADTVAEFKEFTFYQPLRVADVARNVIALIPLGWFLAAAGAPDGRRDGASRRAANIVVGVAALSASLEIAQAFVRIRIVSGRDVVAQAVGCASGVAAWTLVGERVVRSIERITASRAGNRVEIS